MVSCVFALGILQFFCIQRLTFVVYYIKSSDGNTGFLLFYVISPWYTHGLIEVFDNGFWNDVTEPLPAKRGRADNGRLFFACPPADIFYQIPETSPFPYLNVFEGVY
jgi:hypothetical protein